MFDETVKDSTKAIVYKQIPRYSGNAKINSGKPVDLFYTQDRNKIATDSTATTIDEE